MLDADDWVNTESLGKVLQALNETDVQVAVCGYDTYQVQTGEIAAVSYVHNGQENTGRQKAGQNDRQENRSLKKTELDMEQLIAQWGRYRQLFCLHGMIYRTDFYKSLRYRQPEHVSYDDAFFFTVPCSHADRFCILDTQLYVYRTGSPSQSVSAANREKRIRQLETVIRVIVQTKSRGSEKTKAGREYWYRKLVSVVTDYYVTAFFRFRNKKKGRNVASRFTKELACLDRRLYQKIRVRYRLLWMMSLCGRSEKDFEKILKRKNRAACL